jgi:3-deoxy-D-manno-octulosonate 8-phosphate phosphatase (KDO 8-P phosphatase)
MIKFDCVKWLILDVDGVLTDGRLYYSDKGEEYKVFNVKDGLGISRLRERGVKVAVISGRGNKALKNRLVELFIDEIILNRPDKGNVFRELFLKHGDEITHSICLGDDLPDLELFQECRYSVAVADAVNDVMNSADLILRKKGGDGAVRELCDILVKSKG